MNFATRGRGGLVDDVVDWLDEVGTGVARWFRCGGDDLAESTLDAAKDGIRAWDKFNGIEGLLKKPVCYDKNGNGPFMDQLVEAAKDLQTKIQDIGRRSPKSDTDRATEKLLKDLLNKIACKAEGVAGVNGAQSIGNKADEIENIFQQNR